MGDKCSDKIMSHREISSLPKCIFLFCFCFNVLYVSIFYFTQDTDYLQLELLDGIFKRKVKASFDN